jgi:hypothetical protein
MKFGLKRRQSTIPQHYCPVATTIASERACPESELLSVRPLRSKFAEHSFITTPTGRDAFLLSFNHLSNLQFRLCQHAISNSPSRMTQQSTNLCALSCTSPSSITFSAPLSTSLSTTPSFQYGYDRIIPAAPKGSDLWETHAQEAFKLRLR